MSTKTNTDTVVLEQSILNICNKFGIQGEFKSLEIIHMGNINNTYKVCCEENGIKKEYIIQKVNKYVFSEPLNIMDNITKITKHIHDKVKNAGKDTTRYAVKYYTTDEGKNYFLDDFDDYWRVSRRICNSVAYNSSNDLKILRSAGSAFGSFQMLLSDFDASVLNITIENFHNTPWRLKNFFESVQKNEAGRLDEVIREVEWFKKVTDIASKLERMKTANEIPVRVTHNDTKVNNVLFDIETGEPLVVVDLDTVMPGLAMHDFGDAVRSAACTTAEDETDLDKVQMDLDLYYAFTEGFISQTSNALTKNEIDTMALGAVTITIELASRFLKDYLDGDKYFKILYPNHNIDRARCQIKLACDMLNKFDKMENIVKEVAERV